VFGDGFFAQLEQNPEGAWFGPVESGYGQHVVRVTAYMPASVPSLDEVREAVTRDWIAAETAKIAAQRMSALRARYQIVDTPEEAQR
jgi:parvulin-like peptidyl-prolyl isomerase